MILEYPEQNKDLAIQNKGEREYRFVSVCHRISSFYLSDSAYGYDTIFSKCPHTAKYT